MPSKSRRQHRFMAMCSHAAGREWARRHGVKCVPIRVALEFLRADRRKKRRRKGKRGVVKL